MTLTLEGQAWESSWAAIWGNAISPLFQRYFSATDADSDPNPGQFQADFPQFTPIASLVRSNSD